MNKTEGELQNIHSQLVSEQHNPHGFCEEVLLKSLLFFPLQIPSSDWCFHPDFPSGENKSCLSGSQWKKLPYFLSGLPTVNFAEYFWHTAGMESPDLAQLQLLIITSFPVSQLPN